MTGGLIGYATGYSNQTDGPVFTNNQNTGTTDNTTAPTTSEDNTTKTGDASDMTIPMALAGLAIAAMAAVVLTRRQSQK